MGTVKIVNEERHKSIKWTHLIICSWNLSSSFSSWSWSRSFLRFAFSSCSCSIKWSWFLIRVLLPSCCNCWCCCSSVDDFVLLSRVSSRLWCLILSMILDLRPFVWAGWIWLVFLPVLLSIIRLHVIVVEPDDLSQLLSNVPASLDDCDPVPARFETASRLLLLLIVMLSTELIFGSCCLCFGWTRSWRGCCAIMWVMANPIEGKDRISLQFLFVYVWLWIPPFSFCSKTNSKATRILEFASRRNNDKIF